MTKRDALDKVRARRKSPEYDPLLAAVCEVCGVVRADFDLEERADFNEAVIVLIGLGATPRSVRDRALAFHFQFADTPLTVELLTEHWAVLGHPSGYRDTVNVKLEGDVL